MTGDGRELRDLARSIDGILWEADPATFRFTYVSPQAERILGYPPEQWVSEPDFWRSHLHPEDRESAVEFCVRATRARQHHEFEYRMLAADGHVVWLRDLVTVECDGERPVRLRGLMFDISERKRTAESLRQNEERLRLIVGQLPAAVWTCDRDLRVTSSEGAALANIGLEPGELVGTTMYEVLGSRDPGAPAIAAQLRALAGESTSYEIDFRGRAFQAHVEPLRDPAGGAVGTIGIALDITERKQAEEAAARTRSDLEREVLERTRELSEAKEAAERANRSKSRFLAYMSHELRTPLNAVVGFANVLLKNKAGNQREPDLDLLRRIVASGRHLAGVIDQILDLSKIESGRVTLGLAPVGLADLVEETVEQLKGAALRPGVSLRKELPRPIAPLVTDAQRLKQVLINLIGNALKFTERGSVTVRVAVDAETRRPLRIDVADTGAGIPEERLGTIFEPFNAPPQGLQATRGTGLGLAISRSLAALLGCRLEVRSRVGEGSTFSLVLEDGRAPAQSAAPSRSQDR